VLVAPGPDEGLFTAALPRHDGHTPFFSAVPALSELFLDPRSVSEVGGVPLIPLGRVTRRRHAFPGKRVLDLACSALLVLASAPLLVLVALAIKLDDGGPVFYRQPRTGRDNRTFRMLKFRTMVVDADRMLDQLRERSITDGLLFKMHDDPRITRLGRLLRRTSLDELPQVLNVLRGEMSLVGPRPAIPYEVANYEAWQRERLEVLPGITGLWQVSGRNRLSYVDMCKLDIAYVHSRTLRQDLRILLRTPWAMFVDRGGAS
jgi:lipopolysaccharide/colanic/teichoic acid biosynthesis glycosyltransferase